MNNQQNRTQTTSTLSYNTSLHNLPSPKKRINIASYNIRGLNNNVKLQQWIIYCSQKNLYIIVISETKLKDSSQASLTNSIYKFFTSNYTPIS